MKTSASKIIKSWLNKFNSNSPKNYLNKHTVPIFIVIIFIFAFLFYFLRPVYFDYQSNKTILENNINSTFKLKTNFNGKITYKFFPTPRILVENTHLDFIKSTKKKIRIKKLYILISSFNLKNIESFKTKKIIVENQAIQIYPKDFNSYFNYLTIHKQKNLIFKNCDFFFIDEQGNNVLFKGTNYKEKFSKKKHQIEIDSNFSKNKIRVKFLNRIGSEKKLKISVPGLKQYLDIVFDKESNLNFLSGELKLKFLDTLLLLNFKGKENFKISNSFIRNKFFNSKINGKISFIDSFYFDLTLGVNDIDLRKLLLSYPIFQQGGISKKINGKLNISNKNTESLFGNIKDSKMFLEFENGDIQIKNLSVKLFNNSNIKSNISIINNNRNPIIQFTLNFSTPNAAKFFRKFGLYDLQKNEISFLMNGNIDIKSKKINFRQIIKDNNERISEKEISTIEKSFNRYVLSDGVIGLFDFFKIKKFFQEIY